jgi:hypothetical protein
MFCDSIFFVFFGNKSKTQLMDFKLLRTSGEEKAIAVLKRQCQV